MDMLGWDGGQTRVLNVSQALGSAGGPGPPAAGFLLVCGCREKAHSPSQACLGLVLCSERGEESRRREDR